MARLDPQRREHIEHQWSQADDDRRQESLRRGIVPMDYSEPVAADWPDLLEIVERRVRPERLLSAQKSKSNHGHKAVIWWQHFRQAGDLYAAIDNLQQVLVTPQTSNVQALVFLPATMVFGHTLVVFPFSDCAAFAILQSRCHQTWSAFLGPTMKDDLRYAPSDCFETFPFPIEWSVQPELECTGRNYYHYRADLMVRRDEGLTKTYNRFHDPEETDPEIAQLRDLHAAMDRAVLDAYGWTDIPTDCEFLLDYEIDEEQWGTRKKPYRYRWPDEVRDEVLARLLEFNAERAAAEERSGRTVGTDNGGTRTRRPAGHPVCKAPATAPVPRTLWDVNPVDGDDAGGNPDGTEAQAP